MAGTGQDEVERFRQRLANMSEEDVDRYWADRKEAEQHAELRSRRREHFRHQLGIAIIWIATVLFAFDIGYSQGRTFSGTSVQLAGGVEGCLLIAGLLLMTLNRHRRE